jgi:hypothetical protein
MRLRNLLLAVVAISIMGLSIGLMAQSGSDRVTVTLPYAVSVGEKVLDPGKYEIQRVSSTTDRALVIFSDDKMKYETNVLTIPVLDNKTPEDTFVVLHHIGDQYYFDKIWIQGKTYGYEFVLPERARALQREIAETIPAQYQEIRTTDQSPVVDAKESEAAAQAERDRLAQAERDRQAQLERERQSQAQAERDRQAQLERDQQAERDRQAQLERERQPTVIAQAQRDEQSDVKRDRLPATASNWFAYVLSGCLLIGVSLLLRWRTEQSGE